MKGVTFWAWEIVWALVRGKQLQLAVLPWEKSSVAGLVEVMEVFAPIGCDMR